MGKVSVNSPKTPVTKGSHGLAPATVPNVCKMPGPPAPFVPSPLPNIGKSEMSPQGYSKAVTIEGEAVAIAGATFKSTGDIASQGTGGGLVSCNVEGSTKFVAPGSMDVTIEGKNVQLLGDAMVNNCGPSGDPPNAAAAGEQQGPAPTLKQKELEVDCEEKKNDPRPEKRWDDCMVEQLCAMLKAYNESSHPKKKVEPSPAKPASKYKGLSKAQKNAQNAAYNEYMEGLDEFGKNFTRLVAAKGKDAPEVVEQFHCKCQHEKWSKAGGRVPVLRSGPGKMHPDHLHPVGLGGPISGTLKWADGTVNHTVGRAMAHDPVEYPGGMKAKANCNCTA